MNMYFSLKTLLTFHLVGVVMTAGTMVIQFVIFKKFGKIYPADRQGIPIMMGITSSFPMVGGVGMALLLLSGIGMMALTKGVFMHTLWFQIKLVFIVLLIINAMVIIRWQTKKLKKLLNAEDQLNTLTAINGTQRNIRRSVALQLLLFVIIFALVSFRFT